MPPKNNKDGTEKRRKEIAVLIEEIGLWNVRLRPLAEKYNLSPQQIHADIKKLKERMKIPALAEISTTIAYGYKKALKEVYAILSTGSKREKMEAARCFSQTVESFTKFLEDYKLKDKVADKLDIDQKSISVHFEVSDDQYPELKEYAGLRLKHKGDKSKAKEVHREQ